MGRVRLQDVAEATGVSVATVSIVLSGNRERRISARTCGRVRAAAESLGYASPTDPPPIRGLGVLLHLDGDPAGGAPIVAAIQAASRSLGLPPVQFAYVERRSGTRFAVKSLLARGADSLIFVSNTFQSLNDLHGAPWRSVFVNCEPGPAVPAMGSWAVVVPDHRHLAGGVAERLIRQGQVRLLLVSGPSSAPVALEWVAGLQAEAGAWTPAASVEFVAGANPKELSAAVAAALGRSPEARPTAVIALDADSTNAVLEQGSRLGLSIPHDLTLVTRASEHGDAKPLPSPVCVTTPLADLVGAAVEALSAAAEWRLSTAAKPRTIRVRRRSDPWKLEQLATPRSA